LLVFILKVNVAVFNKLLAKLTHAFRIFWFRVVSDDTGPSSRFHNLLMWRELWLGVYFWGVEVGASRLISIGVNATLH
jgi:hypothetical protein